MPLYPKHVDGYVFSVNLLSYKETSSVSILIYCILLGILILSGIIKILMTELKPEKDQRVLTIISMLIGTLMILLLAVTRGLCRNCCIYFIYNKGNVVAEICENRKLIFNAETEQTAIKAISSVVFYSLALLNLSFAVLNISIVSCTRFKGDLLPSCVPNSLSILRTIFCILSLVSSSPQRSVKRRI